MPVCVGDRDARSAKWSTISRGQDRRMCLYNRMMGAISSVEGADENTSSNRMASMLRRSIERMRLTKFGCGTG